MPAKPVNFSLATLFWLTAAVAVHVAMTKWERIPAWHPSPIIYNLVLAASFVAACYVAKRYQNADLAWSLIAVGWLIAGVLLMEALPDCFAYSGEGMLTSDEALRRIGVWFFIFTGIPFTLSVPAIQLAWRVSRAPSLSRKWMVATVVIAVSDYFLVAGLCVFKAVFHLPHEPGY